MNRNDDHGHEIARLRRLAWVVTGWLVFLIIGTTGISVPILAKLFEPENGTGLITASGWRTILCIVGGTLGSSVSALVSVAERISHGWEFASGEKYPQDEPRDKVVARMVPFFLVRPFIGAAMGLLVYAGVTAGYLIAVENAGGATFSRNALLFLSFMGGLFAKTFLEKLRTTFDTMFGASARDSEVPGA